MKCLSLRKSVSAITPILVCSLKPAHFQSHQQFTEENTLFRVISVAAN